MSTPSSKDKEIEVTILKDGLTYAGKKCAKGDKVKVSEARLKRLANRGFIADTKGGK